MWNVFDDPPLRVENTMLVTENWADGIGAFKVTKQIVRLPFYVKRPPILLVDTVIAMPTNTFFAWVDAMKLCVTNEQRHFPRSCN